MTPERWRQIEELYHAACERDPKGREALLAQATAEARSEVEALLAQDASGSKILDRPAAELLEESTVTQLGAGAQLGPYKIEASIGAGGMGSVYRAVDTRLGRAVAIKIAATQFSERFEREARAISSLNHPHICALYDVGPNYLVMELVEGETLAARLKKRALSLDQALQYGSQIADALAAAHAQRIVHRDLKPGNVMVTKSGVKVLDFGLAKSDRDATLTATNAVMGTPKYMAPEQREGKDCDARTDIYALGLVLREMAIDPPSHVAHVIDRCLATDPENRWQTARDLKAELEWVPPAPLQVKARVTWPWIAVAAVGVLVAAVGWWYATLPAAPRPVARWTTTLPVPDSIGASAVAISRDGTRLAYDGMSGSTQRIWVRMLDEPEGKPIPGTEGGVRPFFSPDGNWLAYFQGVWGPLKKVPVTGGSPVTLCEDAFFRQGAWGEDDRIVFPGSDGLMRVSASGGGCEKLTTQQKGDFHSWPQMLPGHRSMLFTIVSLGSGDSSRIAVFDMKTRQYRVVVNGGASGRYVPSGHLVYVRSGTMFAVPFDLKRLAVTGSEKPVIEGVYYIPAGGYADYAFSDSGLLVYRTTETRNLKTLEWLDRKGTPQPSPAPQQDYGSVRLSPDGQRVAVEGGDDVWVIELARGALTRLTTGRDYGSPTWTPDGRHVVFGYGAYGTGGLFWAPSDGSSKPEPLLVGRGGLPDSWAPDGKTLLYEAHQGPARIWSLQPAVSRGDGKPRLLFEASSLNESDAQISPEGHWVAYTSDESGKNRVYVRPFPGPGGKTPISIEAGQEPRWRRDGQEMFYRDPEKNQLMAVDVQTGPEFRVGQPHVLFALGITPWDVAPDGKRFLVVKEPEAAAGEAKLQVVENWFEELRQKVPVGR
ncbi:MAG TPA: protein kinase [Bryobacteraceae bacterium]|nr:protein kinase [Bryobacteraceae bacterium]